MTRFRFHYKSELELGWADQASCPAQIMDGQHKISISTGYVKPDERTSQNMRSMNTETDQPENPAAQKQYTGRSIAKLPENYPPGFLRKIMAEIIGTYLLVFVASGTAAQSAFDEQKVSKLGASLAGGFIVMVMIYAIGHISGAHINPAVSLAFAASGHFPWKQVPFYVGAQMTGGISASFTLRLLLDPMKKLGTTSPSGTDAQALAMEIVATFTLMFVICAVTTDAKAVGELAGVAVGFSVCIAGILAGPISGGSMNPARTLGPAIASGSYKGIWVYLVGPVVGALLGAWSYSTIQENDNNSVRGTEHVGMKDDPNVVRANSV
ncbi:aquaporin NIP2-1-like [Neltuma alba]|uniref:aquaporin NIP2-1-like n=1 Tax=Neltuma alba TaxID=207710 RepID=UPI0010A432D9|nr:aquaporin NIP2-1-like [Prosopis alba]